MTQRNYDKLIKALRANGYRKVTPRAATAQEWVKAIWHNGTRYCLIRWSIHDLRGHSDPFTAELSPYTLNVSADIPSINASVELRGEGKSVQAAEAFAQAFLEFATLGY